MTETPLQYVRFATRVSLLQEIIDTDTGEILFSLESHPLTLNVKYFCLIILKYIKFLREQKNNIQLRIRVYSPVRGTNEIGFVDETSCPF